MSDSNNNTPTDNNQQLVEGKQTPEKYDELGYKVEQPENESEPEKKDEPSSTGYKNDDKSDDEPEEKDDDKSDDEPEEKDDPEKKSKTGYKDKITEPKEESENEDDDPEPSDPDKLKAELEESVKELPESFNREKILEFALKNKLNKDQLAAYSQMAKEEAAALKKDQERAKAAIRKQWQDELKNDATFGGSGDKEIFDKNIHKIDKIIEKYFPNTEKTLTDKGGMLPPYLMKDLLRVTEALDPKNTLPDGDPPQPPKKEGNFLDEMYK